MSQSSQTVQCTEQEGALYEEIVRRIVALADPDKIIVFGSRARGDHRADSDIDILVIKESPEPRYKRSRVLYGALANLPRAVDVDISVYTPEEVADWREVRQAFVTTATREGIVLYERPS
jgi:uncharacterized protein